MYVCIYIYYIYIWSKNWVNEKKRWSLFRKSGACCFSHETMIIVATQTTTVFGSKRWGTPDLPVSRARKPQPPFLRFRVASLIVREAGIMSTFSIYLSLFLFLSFFLTLFHSLTHSLSYSRCKMAKGWPQNGRQEKDWILIQLFGCYIH